MYENILDSITIPAFFFPQAEIIILRRIRVHSTISSSVTRAKEQNERGYVFLGVARGFTVWPTERLCGRINSVPTVNFGFSYPVTELDTQCFSYQMYKGSLKCEMIGTCKLSLFSSSGG